MFFKRIKRWYRQWQLCRHRVPIMLWKRVVKDALSHHHLSRMERHQLRVLSSLFLQDKTINGAGGQEITDYIRVVIASQACLLILRLGLNHYDGWHEIILYPDSFVVTRKQSDGMGLVHERNSVLGGEAWGKGPLILSWNDARPRPRVPGSDDNVILHEFAHKLDMLNGAANGMPPLHSSMDRQTWTDVLSHDYAQLLDQLNHRHHTALDAYGAENPAEFFAVASETFFEAPRHLHRHLPKLYQQLVLYYRQDPLKRQGR